MAKGNQILKEIPLRINIGTDFIFADFANFYFNFMMIDAGTSDILQYKAAIAPGFLFT
jgi:hypothetical protein